jgi:hypothetical protein
MSRQSTASRSTPGVVGWFFRASSRRGFAAAACAAACFLASAERALAQGFPSGDCWEGWQNAGNRGGTLFPDQVVRALAFQPPGGGAGPAGSVIFGGDFNGIDGIGTSARFLARYNLATGARAQLGATLNARVRAIAVIPGGDVIVGGDFSTAGAAGVGRIARYIDATGAWSTMAGGVSGTSVAALLTLPSGDVVVGGTFTSVGPGVAAQNIAIYRPATNTWQSVGGITGGPVPTVASLALTASGDVLVGGRFTTAGGVPAGNIARYRPSTGAWSAVGGGVLDLVNALMELPGGDLLHGSDWGLFRFNSATQTWSPFNEFVAGTLALATLPDGSVLVGGRGDAQGGQPFERYRPDPAPLGSSTLFAGGVYGAVRAILVLPSGLVWVGGAFAQGNSQNLMAYAVPGTLPAFARQPAPMLTVVGGTAVFDLSASALGAVTFRWQKDGVPLDIVANPTAATPILRLSNLQPSDAGSYVCIVTGSCNDLPLGSAPATLTFPGPACPADFNGDQFVDFFDFTDFVEAFEAGC